VAIALVFILSPLPIFWLIIRNSSTPRCDCFKIAKYHVDVTSLIPGLPPLISLLDLITLPEEWEIVRICGQQMDAKSASRCWKNHGFFAYSY
jgi:hypothetical protein